MEITEIKEADIPACLTIFNYYVLNTTCSFEEEPLTLPQYQERVHHILEKYPFLVAKEGNTVLGFAYLDAFNYRKGYRITADLTIYLDQNQLHRHIGKALLDEIEKEARLRGIINIVSLITSSNDISIAFHQKNGFVEEGHLKEVAIKMNQRLGIYYYRKELK